ncbi:phenylalanine--tRNA ligase beta subunit [Sphingobacterium faecium NBRC 15299]|uniref:phenylalanine--tRNA ligase subunit beta n=1 Tax=Sphingobacterium faecium TaxID=34087 RepID=UPI000D35F020|nr:phenylalanine--tRNA ligase subunit beta [Sphingobacterium faecium]PTX12040.1 phenylalanyl-tRNA synthetase beta subunit [Sphingobacterium faecium]GEM63193.1 phenylalanine--tRNA ligase beta subunit [Sphingobacterium faecium NBRC 15299]
MNISYKWLKDHIDIDTKPEELSLILTNVGLEVEVLDVVQSIPGGLAGLVIGEVKSCEQHPNADKLKVTTVDVGQADLLHIVCGAPNVAVGQKVIVATVGSTVHPTSGEPFKINKSKIRGEVSEGMLCGEDEVGLGNSHAGIVELPLDAQVGTLVKDFYHIEDDYRYEIGLTPNRADAASHLGVARDIAAFYRKEMKASDLSLFKEGTGINTEVVVENHAGSPRYSGINISGVQVKESPDWLKERLNVIGIRPINNIVDVTNFILHDLGQPLHAFDQDKIAGNQIVVRQAKQDELFTTLDAVERKLSAEDLVIADAEKPMCIAGVFGGAHSGVSESTTNIFLESAYFNAVSIRKTAKRHQLKTDSSFRYERGTDPNITVNALKKAAILIQEVAGGHISSQITDLYPSEIKPFAFHVSYHNVRRLIGQDIPDEEIRSIIVALGIGIEQESTDGLDVLVPAYRVDVTREVDVIEEVLRIYGYNNVELKPQIKSSLNTSEKPDKEVVLNQLADLLIANGFRETLSNSLTKLDYADDEATAVRLCNPLSSDLDTMRQNMLFSALTTVSYNQKRRNSDLKIFEFGKTYAIDGEGYKEKQHLSIAISGKLEVEQWNNSKQSVNFYNLKAVVDLILKRLKIEGLQLQDAPTDHYAYGLSYLKGTKALVTFGAVSTAALTKADVEGQVFFADFDWDQLLKIIRKNVIKFKEVSKFPAVKRDLSLLIDEAVTFKQLETIAYKTERKLLKEVKVFDVYKGDKIPEGKKSYALSFIIEDDEKTLMDKQIDAIVQKLILNFEKEVSAEVRG